MKYVTCGLVVRILRETKWPMLEDDEFVVRTVGRSPPPPLPPCTPANRRRQIWRAREGEVLLQHPESVLRRQRRKWFTWQLNHKLPFYSASDISDNCHLNLSINFFIGFVQVVYCSVIFGTCTSYLRTYQTKCLNPCGDAWQHESEVKYYSKWGQSEAKKRRDLSHQSFNHEKKMRLQNPMLVEEVINLLIKGNPRSQFAITVKKNVILIYPYFISVFIAPHVHTYVHSTYLFPSLTKTSVKRRLFV